MSYIILMSLVSSYSWCACPNWE